MIDLIERNKIIVKNFIAAINAQNWEKLDQLVSAQVIRHSSTSGQPPIVSLASLKEFLKSEADKVAARLAFTGTQSGAMGPFPASGKLLTANFICIFRLE